MRWRRWGCGILTGLLAIQLAGCSVDVDAYLIPPTLQGEQSEIQQALEEYIQKTNDKTTRYVLKYPQSGDYTSAFILIDSTSGRAVDPTPQADFSAADAADTAIAFYRLGNEGNNIHIHMLHKEGDDWLSVDDVEGLNTNIDQVMFGDLDGDGTLEMLAGWSMYNSQDRQLHIYSIKNRRLTPLSTDKVYSQMFLGDITLAGREDLLLLRISSGNQVTARLLYLKGEQMTELGMTPLDGYIQRFGSIRMGMLAEDIRGVYIDAVKEANTTITELLYWDGKQLNAPLYDRTKNVNTWTARESGFAAMDIDGDREMEYPQSSRLPGYEQETAMQEYMWINDWYSWEYATRRSVKKAANIVLPTDGYSVQIDDTWRGHFTTSYDTNTRTLWLYEWENDQQGAPFLAFRTEAAGDFSKTEEGPDFQIWHQDQAAGITYSAWYSAENPYDMNMEKINYIATVLEN